MHSHNHRRPLTLVASLFILATLLACTVGNTIQRLVNTRNVAAPTAIPTLDIVHSLSESALLKTEDLTFGGDFPAQRWQNCPDSIRWWSLWGLPGNVTQLVQVSGAWSFGTCEDYDVTITEDIIVLENPRHTERAAASILDTTIPAWTINSHNVYLSTSGSREYDLVLHRLVVVLDETNTLVVLELTHGTSLTLVEGDLQELSEMAVYRLETSLNQR